MTSDTLLIGKASEHLFITRCLMEGIVCYLPVSDGGKVDVLIGTSLKRCQIKSIQHGKVVKGLPLRKTGGQNTKCYRYSCEDIDFIVGCDLAEMNVYIVPIADVEHYRAIISPSALEKGGYRNNFDALLK